MDTKYLLFAVAAVIILTRCVSWLRSRGVRGVGAASGHQVSLTELTDGERHVYDLLREVQGHAILSEVLVREGDGLKAQLTLDTDKTKVASLNINLTSLARKQKEEGLSDGAMKRGFTF